ncbi:MAG: Fic/DOC family protein [Gammaproteobacteria bacterium]
MLKNRLGIKSAKEMEGVEARALKAAMSGSLGTYDADHRFTAADVCELHKTWLGEIYEWAGNYRRVNISKGDFPFAVAAQIPTLMNRFERDVLGRTTPCKFKDKAAVIRALAESHVKLVLIHPFRDGNGRVVHMLSTLMALQAGLPLLDFGLIAGKKKNEYFSAVEAGMDKNYEPMERLFAGIIDRLPGAY